jgi:ATP-dependent Lon protease
MFGGKIERKKTKKNIKLVLFFFEKVKMVKSNDIERRPITRSSKKKCKSNDVKAANHPPQPFISKIVVPRNFFSGLPPMNDRGFALSPAEEKYLSNVPAREKSRLLSELKRNTTSTKIPMRFRILKSNLPNKSEILQRVTNSCDNPKFDAWIESLLSLPLGKLAPAPVSDISKINDFLVASRKRMDDIVYGQEEAKDEIMRLLCQWSTSGNLNSFAIGLEGPPGIGKTTFAKNVISELMRRPFNFISLGGATDSAQWTGHSFTYEGAIPGRIVECLRSSNVMNPCFYFDELDKISKTAKGDEITNVLIHLTDKEQNSEFHDRYFHGINFNLSESLFIFSYNDVKQINPVLLDRINVIKFKPPNMEEKIEIAKRHLIPKTLAHSGITEKNIKLTEDSIKYIIDRHTCECGVRNLEKALSKLISTISLMVHAPMTMTSYKWETMDDLIDCNVKLIDAILSSEEKDTGAYMAMYN